MIIPKILSHALAVLASASLTLVSAPQLNAQQETLTVYTGTGHEGYFCGYEEDELGDYPDVIVIRNGRGIQRLSASLPTDEDNTRIAALAPGTHMTYSVEVLYLYDESSESMMSLAGLTDFKVGTAETNPGACAPARAGSDYYTAQGVSGVFCGYEPPSGTDDTGSVSLKTESGTAQVKAWVMSAESLRALASMSPGTPVSFDLSVMTETEPDDVGGEEDEDNEWEEKPAEVGITAIASVGEPVEGACAAAAPKAGTEAPKAGTSAPKAGTEAPKTGTSAPKAVTANPTGTPAPKSG
ncbi:MAG: hypothetical protein LBQ79_11990, partial [Deltaproteobacteria bacterium]|nr:hypothetical protein [Deltaproteobacteria bacterium]